MGKTVKDRRFWVCAALFGGLLWLALHFEHIDQYHPFPYICIFHAATIFSWLSGLYCRWSGRWKPGDSSAWGVLVLLCALPQLLMCMVSFVSWVLLGVSLALGVTAVLRTRR